MSPRVTPLRVGAIIDCLEAIVTSNKLTCFFFSPLPDETRVSGQFLVHLPTDAPCRRAGIRTAGAALCFDYSYPRPRANQLGDLV